MKFTERVYFRLIQTPCCGHSLCWVNPRLPTYCPECGSHMFADIKQAVIFSDNDATLNYQGD